jgi:hypothetical protein
LHHDKAPSYISFLTRGLLPKNNMTVVPHPPYISRLKIKLEGRRFDATEVIEAESQAMLNTTSRAH